jgi:hypothetical protein
MSFEDFINGLTDEQKSALMESLQIMKNKPKPKPRTKAKPKTVKQSEEPVVENDFRITSVKKESTGRTPVRFKKNEWIDDGEESRDVETPKHKLTPRHREKAKKVEVECHVCGKTFYENPNYIYGEYLRCSRCASRR